MNLVPARSPETAPQRKAVAGSLDTYEEATAPCCAQARATSRNALRYRRQDLLAVLHRSLDVRMSGRSAEAQLALGEL